MTVTAKTTWPLGTRPNIKKLSTPLAGPINIYCQGGSITTGYTPDDQSWVRYLATLLTGAGLDYAMTGPYSTLGTPSYSCGAIAGSSILNFSQAQANDINVAPRATPAAAADIIILECTVNTASDAGQTATWRADLVAFVAYVLTFNANARFVILTDQDAGDPARRARLATLRAEYPQLVIDLDAAGHSDRYVIAPVRTICKDTDMMSVETLGSRVHMNERGAERMASNIFPAVMNAAGLDAGWPGAAAGPLSIAYVSGFVTSTNYLNNAGIAGTDAHTFYAALVHRTAGAGGTIFGRMSSAVMSPTTAGWGIYKPTASTVAFGIRDSVGLKVSPSYTLVAGDVGKVLIFHGVIDVANSIIRLYRNGVEVGSGTAIVGSLVTSGNPMGLGSRNAGSASVGSDLDIAAAGAVDVVMSAAECAAHAAASIAANKVILPAVSYTTALNWSAEDYATPSWPDEVSASILTTTGTLSTGTLAPGNWAT